MLSTAARVMHVFDAMWLHACDCFAVFVCVYLCLFGCVCLVPGMLREVAHLVEVVDLKAVDWKEVLEHGSAQINDPTLPRIPPSRMRCDCTESSIVSHRDTMRWEIAVPQGAAAAGAATCLQYGEGEVVREADVLHHPGPRPPKLRRNLPASPTV